MEEKMILQTFLVDWEVRREADSLYEIENGKGGMRLIRVEQYLCFSDSCMHGYSGQMEETANKRNPELSKHHLYFGKTIIRGTSDNTLEKCIKNKKESGCQ